MYIVWLSGADEFSRELLGGKAWNLNRLVRAGFEVPLAFCVTTRAFDDCLDAMLRQAGVGPGLQELIVEQPLLSAVEREIRAAVRQARSQGKKRLVVRSSATTEDTEKGSFAGQNASFMNLATEEQVIRAVRQCWASMYSREAILYGAALAMNEAAMSMGVVVQEMIDPDTAGVLFTADPTDPSSGTMILSASLGLGETVVSGRHSDTWRIGRNLEVLDARISEKNEQLKAAARGGVRACKVDSETARRPCLTNREISRISRLGRNIELALGCPQDIEWAASGGRLHLLQARPVTALARAGSRSVWTRTNVGEALPGVATPYTWSVIHAFSRLGLVHAFGAIGCTVPEDFKIVGDIRGRVYLNLSEFMEVFSQIPFVSPEMLFNLGGGGGLEDLPETYRGRSPWNFVARLPLSGLKFLGSFFSTPGKVAAWRERFDAFRDSFYAKDLSALSANELRALFNEVAEVFDRTGVLLMEVSSQFLLSYMLMSAMLGQRPGGAPQESAIGKDLFSGLSGLRSAEPGLDLLRMAIQINTRPGLAERILAASEEELQEALRSPETWAGAFHAFISSHGHRAVREAELSEKRWREDPSFPLELLRSYLRAQSLPHPEQLLEERRQRRQQATAKVLAGISAGLRGLFVQILTRSQQAARVREELRSNVVHTMSFYRGLALECGRRLREQGRLEQQGDVFFFLLPELKDWLEKGEDRDFLRRAALRKRKFTVFASMPDPPEWFVLENGKILPPTTAEKPSNGNGHKHRGLPASPGVSLGSACVVRGPEDFSKLQQGDVLVAPYADVGWTPLFLLATAVVTDLGGPLSHSCVVAREYGIPAVVNLRGATRLFKDGDMLRVDGSSGEVELL